MRSRLLLTSLAAAAVAALVSGLVARDAVATHDSTAELRAELHAYQAAYHEMADGLDRLEKVADRLRDRRAQRKLDRIIERTRERAADQLDDVHDDDDRDDDRERVVTAAELQRIVTKIEAESFSDDQLALVGAVAKASWFTADQVLAVMKACDWDDTRIEAAVLLYPRTVDADNWYLVYEAFTYSSSKRKLRERLGQQGDQS
jgi:hypothetical protein